MAIRGDDAVARPSPMLPWPRVLLLDGVLVVATTLLVIELATHLPVWVAIPAALVIATTAFVLVAVVTAYAATHAEARVARHPSTQRDGGHGLVGAHLP